MMVTLSQNSHESLFPNLTLKENFLLTQARAHEKKSLVQFCKHLEKFNLNLVSKLDTLVMKLSGGEKQALMLALAVLHPPKILLLDEHTSALDPNTAQQLMKVTGEIVAEYGITCVLTTHDLGVALGFGERIVSLRQGKILRLVEKEEKHRLQKEELLGLCY
jgi:putative ABC transport system ATP-binding protein